MRLVNRGVNINMIISDAFCETALMYAVKYGQLKIVETLVKLTNCNLDHLDRNQQSALDMAIRAWLLQPIKERSVEDNTRYRIVECLLKAGSRQLSFKSLKGVITSVTRKSDGLQTIGQLVRLVCECGSVQVTSNLLGILASLRGTGEMLTKLIQHGACLPACFEASATEEVCLIPSHNAIILLRAFASPTLMRCIEDNMTGHLADVERHWMQYRHVVRLLVMAGYKPQMSLMNHLYSTHASMYRWIVLRQIRPNRLQDLTRNAIRREMPDNLVVGLKSLREIPNPVKQFLLFNDLWWSRSTTSIFQR